MDLSAGEVPNQPGVHCAGAQLSPFRPCAGTGHVVQNPLDFRAGEIGVNQQSGLLRHHLPQAVRFQLVTDGGGPAALPHNGIVDGGTGLAVPEDGGLPLVGDAQGGNGFRVDMGGVHCLRQRPFLRGPDLHGVVFHPAGLGVNLMEGVLGPGDNLPGLVE